MAHFFLKLIAPRISFAVDMTDTEKAVMQAHAAYWSAGLARGEVVLFGPVMDPAGPFGLGILAMEDARAVKAFADADPAITSGIGFACEIYPMRAITRDTPHP